MVTSCSTPAIIRPASESKMEPRVKLCGCGLRSRGILETLLLSSAEPRVLTQEPLAVANLHVSYHTAPSPPSCLLNSSGLPEAQFRFLSRSRAAELLLLRCRWLPTRLQVASSQVPCPLHSMPGIVPPHRGAICSLQQLACVQQASQRVSVWPRSPGWACLILCLSLLFPSSWSEFSPSSLNR